jgi:ComF family protein
MKCAEWILKVLFPPHCLACHGDITAGVICKSCFDKISPYRTLFCAHCGARLPGGPVAPKKICHRDVPYLLGSAGSYDDVSLQLLIHHLKFRGVRRAAEPLATLLARYVHEVALDLSEYILIPLPLSWRRQHERGFNQSEEIAKYLVERVPLTLRTDVLVRSGHAKPQTETVSVAERRRNILGCFSVIKPDAIRHKNVIVLDDVTTSGATLGDAARALKIAGARQIVGLTAAKA